MNDVKAFVPDAECVRRWSILGNIATAYNMYVEQYQDELLHFGEDSPKLQELRVDLAMCAAQWDGLWHGMPEVEKIAYLNQEIVEI